MPPSGSPPSRIRLDAPGPCCRQHDPHLAAGHARGSPWGAPSTPLDAPHPCTSTISRSLRRRRQPRALRPWPRCPPQPQDPRLGHWAGAGPQVRMRSGRLQLASTPVCHPVAGLASGTDVSRSLSGPVMSVLALLVALCTQLLSASRQGTAWQPPEPLSAAGRDPRQAQAQAGAGPAQPPSGPSPAEQQALFAALMQGGPALQSYLEAHPQMRMHLVRLKQQLGMPT